jgi:hypothetical protein
MDARHIQARYRDGMVLMANPTAAYIERLAGERTSDGKLPSFTSLGCYPLIYITHDADVLCADCATEQVDSGNDTNFDPVVAVDVYWEGADYQCGNCNGVIAAAYGNPWADDNTEGE